MLRSRALVVSRTVRSLRLADLEKSIWHPDRVFLSQRSAPQIWSPRGSHIQRKTKSRRYSPCRSLIRTAAPAGARSSLAVDAVNGRRDGWAGRQQHHSRSGLHQHPQADHVGTHVPENADASHRPGWALRWKTGAACGLSGMRQTWKATHCLGQKSDKEREMHLSYGLATCFRW